MRAVVLGLSITSSWGNGHATNFRALQRALTDAGHDVVFLERDKPWYAAHRDLPKPPWGRTVLYDSIAELQREHLDTIAGADLVVIGSYVPDGAEIGRWLNDVSRFVAFYDIDTPVTLAALDRGACEYLTRDLIPRFDVYLSFTGGPTLARLENAYGAQRAVAFHCFVDPNTYRPVEVDVHWDLGYLGTYSDDRQPTLERLLLEPARRRPDLRFVVAGPGYPESIDWPANVERIEHLPPGEHPGFYAGQRFTLNVTRGDMIRAGWSPSVRLFEAAACGTPLISDRWDGIDAFFTPGNEIVLADTAEDVLGAIGLDGGARKRMGIAARRRVLERDTARHRVEALEALVGQQVRT